MIVNILLTHFEETVMLQNQTVHNICTWELKPFSGLKHKPVRTYRVRPFFNSTSL